jgi:hypothetical protein
MSAVQDAIVARARKKIVAKYREHPGLWPDGIDHPGNRWYKSGDWNDAGGYLGDDPFYAEVMVMRVPPVVPDTELGTKERGTSEVGTEALGQVEALLKQGHPVRAIAERTGMSKSTVQRIKEKLAL